MRVDFPHLRCNRMHYAGKIAQYKARLFAPSVKKLFSLIFEKFCFCLKAALFFPCLWQTKGTEKSWAHKCAPLSKLGQKRYRSTDTIFWLYTYNIWIYLKRETISIQINYLLILHATATWILSSQSLRQSWNLLSHYIS